MEEDQSMTGGYSSVVDSELGTVADTTVIGIDAHLDDPDAPERPDQYRPPTVTPATLAEIEEQLESLNKDELATTIKTRRQQLADNQSALNVSAAQLSELALTLSIAMAKSQFLNNADAVYAITQFGNAIAWSTDGPLLADSIQYKHVPRVKPTGELSYIDPFEVIANNQSVVFTDERGNKFTTDD